MNLDGREVVVLLALSAVVLVLWPVVEHLVERRAWRRRMDERRRLHAADGSERERLMRERIRGVLRSGGLLER